MDKAIRMYPLPDILRSHMYYTTCLQCIHDAAGPRITFCFCFFSGRRNENCVNEGVEKRLFAFPNAASWEQGLQWNAPYRQPLQTVPGLRFFDLVVSLS